MRRHSAVALVILSGLFFRPSSCPADALRHEADARRGEGRVVLRRLNRVQYENTVRDLLAIDAGLKDLLPEDTPADGFDTVAEALKISPEQMESYLEAADAALDAAMVRTPRPPSTTRRFRLQDEQMVQRNPRLFRILEDAVVLFNPSPRALPLLGFRASEPGRYKFRVSASVYQSDQPLALSFYAGDVLNVQGESKLLGYFDVPSAEPAVIAFEHTLGLRDTIKLLPYGVSNNVYSGGDPADYRGPGVAVQWIEIEGPLSAEWPPESHRRLFDDLPLEPVGSGTVPVAVSSAHPRADAERLLRRFLPRAFRRPVDDTVLHSFRKLVWERLDAGYRFDEAMRVGYKAVLCAPEFLFLVERPGRLDDFALASRLAYFLWSSQPDDALLERARAGTLAQPDVLRAETERLLGDPRAHRFTDDFVGQWLNLRQIEETTPDRRLYPEFDELLQLSMVRETALYFEELLAHDLGVRNVVDSDFAMLNQRMARHYGIAGVVGNEFRRVTLPPGSHRGGVLTQASVLKVTANGTSTSPVRRGVWVLNNILGTPPDPPPPNVPAIEPDTRGTTTIRAQLEAHRNRASCAGCHDAIDPLGFALESYDVVGSWRTSYRAADRRVAGQGAAEERGFPAALVPELIRRLDTNKDGTIEKAEVAPMDLVPFRRVLNAGDANHDGKLDPAELMALQKPAAPAPAGQGGERAPGAGRPQGQPADPNLAGRALPGALPVDPAGALPDGRPFQNIDGLKQLLLGELEQVARCVTEKLLVYATGAAIDAADSPAVAAIVGRAADRDYGLRSLVHEVVQSELFRTK